MHVKVLILIEIENIAPTGESIKYKGGAGSLCPPQRRVRIDCPVICATENEAHHLLTRA